MSDLINTAGATTDEISMQFPDKLNWDQYEAIGKSLAQIADFSNVSLPWYIGDWLNYGEAKYPDRYNQAVKFTGLAYSTLCNYAYTSRHVPRHVRRPTLGISIHHEVASLKDTERQDELLRQAEENGWSKQEVRAAIKGKAPTKALPDKMPSFDKEPKKLITFEEWYSEHEEDLAQAEDEFAAYEIVWHAARRST